MSARFEAVALKKLQEIMQAKGISAEAVFAKYDINGDGSLDVTEFNAAISSITGQNAPDAIVRAVFSALDSDGNASLDISELLALVEGGQSAQVTGEVNGAEISGHSNSDYNGLYNKQDGLINDYPWFKKPNGQVLFHYDGGDGGARSWSLHSSPVDGSKDLYDGGWTRPPSSGEIPFGTRRWVGVGMLTISAVGERSTPSAREAEGEDTSEIRIELQKGKYPSYERIKVDFTSPLLTDESWLGIVPADVSHGEESVNRQNRLSHILMAGQTIGTHTFDNPGPGDWTIRLNDSSDSGKELAYVEFTVEAATEPRVAEVASPSIDFIKDGTVLDAEFAKELENLVANPESTIESVRAQADVIAEEKINELPFFFRSPASRMWDSNADSILAKIRGNLPPPEDFAKAAAVAGAVGVGAAAVAAQAGMQAQSPQEAIVGAVVDTVINQTAGAVLESVAPVAEAPPADPEPIPEPEPVATPAAELETAATAAVDSGGLDLEDVTRRLTEARFLNDQIAVVASTEGLTTSAIVHIHSLERTFSIGIDDAYRGGQTIVGSIDGVGEVEVHLKANADTSDYTNHQTETFTVSVHKWNGIRKRIELNAQ